MALDSICTRFTVFKYKLFTRVAMAINKEYITTSKF